MVRILKYDNSKLLFSQRKLARCDECLKHMSSGIIIKTDTSMNRYLNICEKCIKKFRDRL
jgi:hypothetical protein